MTCSKCRRTMIERKRVYHGQRKWVCPRCGHVRFQKIKKPRRSTGSSSRTGRGRRG